jgi:hypothetical protein
VPGGLHQQPAKYNSLAQSETTVRVTTFTSGTTASNSVLRRASARKAKGEQYKAAKKG